MAGGGAAGGCSVQPAPISILDSEMPEIIEKLMQNWIKKDPEVRRKVGLGWRKVSNSLGNVPLHEGHLVLGPPEVFLDGEERGQRAWQGARTRGCISLRQSRGWQGYQPGHLGPVPVPTPLLRP